MNDTEYVFLLIVALRIKKVHQIPLTATFHAVRERCMKLCT